MAKDVGGKGDEADAAAKDVGGKGGAARLVNDVVGRAADLGGWLVVSFIAPVPPSNRNSTRVGIVDAIGKAAARAAREAPKVKKPEKTVL